MRSTLSQLVRSLAALLPILLVGCAATGRVQEKPAEAPRTGQVGNIMLVDNTARTSGDKVIVAVFHFAPDRVYSREVIATFGPNRPARTDARDYVFQLVDRQGRVITEYGIWNPRKVVVEKQGVVETPEATYAARFPFDSRAREVRLLDSSGNVVATTQVSSVVSEFCARLKQDKDCMAPER